MVLGRQRPSDALGVLAAFLRQLISSSTVRSPVAKNNADRSQETLAEVGLHMYGHVYIPYQSFDNAQMHLGMWM